MILQIDGKCFEWHQLLLIQHLLWNVDEEMKMKRTHLMSTLVQISVSCLRYWQASRLNYEGLISSFICVNLMERNRRSIDFISFFKNGNLQQAIDKHTHISEKFERLNDHIFVNNVGLYSHQGDVDTGLSGHDLIFTAKKFVKPLPAKETRYITLL